jgi:hypothetical protein
MRISFGVVVFVIMAEVLPARKPSAEALPGRWGLAGQ